MKADAGGNVKAVRRIGLSKSHGRCNVGCNLYLTEKI